MNKFLLYIIALYLLLTPFYVFGSGLPQPADLLIGFASVVLLLTNSLKDIIKDKIIKYFLRFLILVFFIDVSYFFVLSAQGVQNRMFMPVVFYIFNFFFFTIFLKILSTNLKQKNIDWVILFVIISLFIQVVLAIMGVQGGVKEEGETATRATIFFNNPNQLGYYALLMLSLFTVMPSKFRKNKLGIVIVISLSVYLILYSGSRAALAGVILLAGLMLFKEGFKIKLSSILLIVLAFFSIGFFVQTDFVQKKIELIEARNDRFDNTNVSEAQVRGYDRFWLHPEYVFYGAGEGKNDRFDSYHKLEMHSGFGTILFCYGILGFFLFLRFIYKTIEDNKIYNFLLLLPIIAYNITHHGLRDPLFWGILASIYVVSKKNDKLYYV